MDVLTSDFIGSTHVGVGGFSSGVHLITSEIDQHEASENGMFLRGAAIKNTWLKPKQ